MTCTVKVTNGSVSKQQGNFLPFISFQMSLMSAEGNAEESTHRNYWHTFRYSHLSMTTAPWKSNSETFFAPAPTNDGASEVRIANPGGPLELVMVVDDDDFIRLLAERVLTAEGYRVVTARDGYQAMDYLARLGDKVDLVVLDFVMPSLDGARVLQAMRNIVPNLPIIVTSGFTENTGLRDLLARGVCGFIPKPLARNKLLLSIRATIDEFRGTL